MVSGGSLSRRVITVMLVDDHALFTAGLRELLSFYDDLRVVAAVDSGDCALVEVQRLAPDVVLMDLQMPGLDGVAATRRISVHHAGTAVLALTMHDDDASVLAVLRAGARGYVLKGAHQEELVAAIRAVSRGEAVFGAPVADRVLGHFAFPRAVEPPLPELTARERDVLELLARGTSTNLIASTLRVTPKTVRNHLSAIFAKLQVSDRAAAMLKARAAGMGDTGEGDSRT